MSRFLELTDAVRGPFEFARDHPETVDRTRGLRETLVAGLRRCSELRIPPEAKLRLEQAARTIESDGLAPEVLQPVSDRLAPILDPEYAERALAQPTQRLPGVGPKTAEALARKEIRRIDDLLFFLPRSYEDRRELIPIAELQVGRPACFRGTVTRADLVSTRRGRRLLQAVVSDGTASVQLKWFRGIPHFRDRIVPGVELLVAGDVRRYRYAKELHHPEVEALAQGTSLDSLPRIVPTYSTVEGVPPRTLRRVVEAAVERAGDLVEEWLPAQSARELALPDIGASLREVHLPDAGLDPEQLRSRSTPYHLRLVIEELFLLQVGLELRRSALSRRSARPLPVRAPVVTRSLRRLPFQLTADQRRAWDEIAADLARPRPMNRLLVGDVGTGKTVLAVLAAVAAHAAKGLSAVLAPTEILAEQHFATFRELAGPLGLRVALLTGSTLAPERRSLQRLLQLGEIAIVIGTHALLSGSVALPRLSLCVIDEQHRFGVEQRRRLGEKGENPHVLVMSATPIPRTLALTVVGDLDHSTLRERPPGRVAVETRVVPSDAGREVLDQVKRTLGRGEQIYVVYPLVEESEKQDLQDATRGFERLGKALPGVPLALLHGRLDASERSRAMARFSSGEVRLLVSTSVIEVGVDVQNATLLVVQHAERFGLAQLHQLRGRVGRGRKPGLALLIAEPRSEDASRRLAVLAASNSGFEIAEEDLRIRGPGQWLGTRQAGHLPELRLADLVRHGELLPPVRAAATRLLRSDPALRRNPRLRTVVERRWGHRLDLSTIA
ncbi:MAG: ATP-dependent DNA helicase RecG [Myxococcota bacterium]